MAIITRPQGAYRTTREYPAAIGNSEQFAPLITHARHSGHSAARKHTTHIRVTWPERYRERYRLPSGIEEQPF